MDINSVITPDKESVNRPVGPISPRTSSRDIGPVKSLQKMLRNIAYYKNEIPIVIDDGIFGDSTENAVIEFQRVYGLEPTGIVNFDTWNKIVSVSMDIDNRTEPADRVLVFNESNTPISPGDKTAELYVLQAMLLALSEIIDNIAAPDVSGIHDNKSVLSVKSVQKITGLDDNGIIDVDFSNHLGALYEVYVTAERVKGASPV